MQRREINRYIKQNCAPSWTYLRDLMFTGYSHAVCYVFISQDCRLELLQVSVFERVQQP